MQIENMTTEQLTTTVLKSAAEVFDECMTKINHCLAQLSDEQVWWRPREEMNSIGNLLLHLSGNVKQWIVSGLGDAQDVRNRPAEFSQRGPIPTAEVLQPLARVVADAKSVLGQRTAAEMLTERHIQEFEVTGWEAVFDCMPHFKGHTQEIICLTRLQLGDAYRVNWKPQTAEH